jgi:hypothetical protein
MARARTRAAAALVVRPPAAGAAWRSPDGLTGARVLRLPAPAACAPALQD